MSNEDLSTAPPTPDPNASNHNSHRAAFGEWLREVSALLVVFPVIDQLVDESSRIRFNWWVAVIPWCFGLIFLVLGIALVPRSR